MIDPAYTPDPLLHQKLVRKIANKFVDRGLCFEDLVAEGQVGLLRAAKKYRVERKIRFVTYAYPFVFIAIDRAVQEQVPLISVPLNLQERLRYKKSKARGSDAKLKAGKQALRAHVNEGALETKGNESKLELISHARPDTELNHRLAQHDLEILMRDLPEDEFEVLCLRYGLFGREQLNGPETAKRLGKFPQWIYVLEARAIGRLKERAATESRRVPA